ncbi:unnamed protein product [Symbiodinium necroappetens]|uniref:Ubiquitin-like domain-containing protein n=1 Tax=Symbiodinium necroappetens TaxID=1628268 RepID=A0A812WX02_9DINO|nr:unnamed protein product [Symbiodinium necroappetens]
MNTSQRAACFRGVRCSVFGFKLQRIVASPCELAPSLVLALTVGRFSHMSVLVKDLVGNEYKLELTGLQTVLDLKKLLEQVVVDLPIPQQRLTLLRTEKRLEPESQQLAALGLKDGDELELQVLSWTEAQGL